VSPQGEKIRVLITDDIAETRENLRKLLSFDPDIEVVGAASSGQEGIALAKEFRPDVILMDINMPGMDGIAATEAILKEVPTAQVVMLSVQGETDYLRSAMLAGARDFLTKPPSGDELMSTIRRVYEMGKTRAPMMPAQPVGVAGLG
jgi:pilus assembly protein CpaE